MRNFHVPHRDHCVMLSTNHKCSRQSPKAAANVSLFTQLMAGCSPDAEESFFPESRWLSPGMGSATAHCSTAEPLPFSQVILEQLQGFACPAGSYLLSPLNKENVLKLSSCPCVRSEFKTFHNFKR